MQLEHSGIKLSAAERTLSRPGPNLGEHTRSVLVEVLGMTAAEIDQLIETGVLV